MVAARPICPLKTDRLTRRDGQRQLTRLRADVADNVRTVVVARVQESMVLVFWNCPACCGFFRPGVWLVPCHPGSISIARESVGSEDSRFTAGLKSLDDTMSSDSRGVTNHGNKSRVRKMHFVAQWLKIDWRGLSRWEKRNQLAYHLMKVGIQLYTAKIKNVGRSPDPKRVTNAMNDTEDVLEKAEEKGRRRSNLYSVQEKGLPLLLIDAAACWRPLMVSARFG